MNRLLIARTHMQLEALGFKRTRGGYRLDGGERGMTARSVNMGGARGLTLSRVRLYDVQLQDVAAELAPCLLTAAAIAGRPWHSLVRVEAVTR